MAAERADAYRSGDAFRVQWGLEHIKADVAYSHLELLEGPDAEPGAGVTLGFIDTGIDLDHPAFAGKTVTEEITQGAVDETGIDDFSHGTAVASVAAGAGEFHGLAWGADVAMFSVSLGSGDGTYRPSSAKGLAAVDAEDAALAEQVLSWRDGARKVNILNLSFGYQGLIDRYTEQELRDSYGSTLAAMAQADAEEKVILVWAAGNSHGNACDPSDSDFCRDEVLNAVSPSLQAGLPAFIEELRGHSIAVAALSPADGLIASFSNRCGIAADFCIAAPGDEVRIAYFGPHEGEVFRGFATGGGTSYAAPMVAGGLAIMKQLFRGQLSNTELVTRLFATADKSGVYADAAVYGQGSMDLGAATSPVGVLEVPGGGSAGRSGSPLSSMRLRPGMAFGDGLRQSLASRQIMALDELAAPFWYRLGSFTTAGGGPSVAARLRGFLAPDPETPPLSLHATRLEASSDVRGSHMSLAEGAVQATLAARGGVSAAAFTTKGLPGLRPTVGAALSWRGAGSPWGVRAGWIGEPETLLGSVGEGGFGGLAADTSFLGVDAHTELDGWRIGANAELGIVAPEARGGFVDHVSSLATSAFALHASRELARAGAVRFSVSQPLRVERGRTSLTVPVSRTKAGAVSYDAVTAGLAPSGRQVDFAGEWLLRPLPQGELRLGAVYSHHPGHRKDAGPELTFLGGWRRAF
ncbi:MAG: S8 family serine peptidase [Deltaproteobacteria bacterium]|nr:S8 family serine peptidase [Deltaproteobacteria bacterium]